MFDILAYLVERFYDFGTYPDQETLSKQLISAGFDAHEVKRALRWLAGLEAKRFGHPGLILRRRDALPAPTRVYAEEELTHIDVDSRGFLQFLETAGVLDAREREIVVDRIVALEDVEVGLDELKLVVLLVLWKQGRDVSVLILDELLAGERAATLH